MKTLDELIEFEKQDLAATRLECKKIVLDREKIGSWFIPFDGLLSKMWRIQQRIFFLENLKKEL